MNDQEDFMNAMEEAIDEEEAGKESEAGLDQWQDYIPSLFRIRVCCGALKG